MTDLFSNKNVFSLLNNYMRYLQFKGVLYGKDETEWNLDSNQVTPIFPEPTPPFPSKFSENTNHFYSTEEFFNFFMSEEIISEIVKCTNQRLISTQELLTNNELRGFFGLLLLFGVTKKNDVDVHEIWNPISVHHLDWATACMPRDRFVFISVKISFDEFSSRDERKKTNPKFFKMDKIFNLFKANMNKALIPGRNLCIDEQLYAFRGNCPFKQYIPSKPAKYGIKIWAMVDCDSVFLVDANIYLG